MPTSWRSTVVNRLARLVALVARLATNGTFRPTTISASSLSVVMMLGAERTFTSESVWRAVRRTVCAGTSWPLGSLTFWFAAAARTRPGSEVGSASAPASVPRFTCARPLWPSSVVPPWNSMPSARVFSSVASRMIASTNTCRRRTSSCSITARSVSQSSGVALTMSALVAGSAVRRTGAASGIAAGVPAAAGSATALTGVGGGACPMPPS